MNNKEILDSILVSSEEEISQVYKKTILSIMKSKKVSSDKEFLEELTIHISSNYVMNMEILKRLPTNVNEFWNMTKTLKIYREFKAYLFNKTPKKQVVKVEKKLGKPLIFK